MQLWHGTDAVPEDLTGTAVTIGTFDGVHRGHQAVLGRTVDAAREQGLLAVAMSFDPHPAAVHRPESQLPLITALPDRLARMADAGLDAVLLIDYTLDFARTRAEDFVREYLVELLRARRVIIGADARFGWENAGDVSLLRRLGAEHGFTVDVVDDLGHPRRWSSTWVRELLATGDVRGAGDVLGRPHRLRGVVVHGHRRGRELGYPTANLAPRDLAVVPADGVYAGWLVRPAHGGQRLPAAISIGTNPTFDDILQRTVEAHVLGRDDLDLYDEEVVVELVERLRPMVAFAGVDALVAQMAQDVADAADVLDADRDDAESRFTRGGLAGEPAS